MTKQQFKITMFRFKCQLKQTFSSSLFFLHYSLCACAPCLCYLLFLQTESSLLPYLLLSDFLLFHFCEVPALVSVSSNILQPSSAVRFIKSRFERFVWRKYSGLHRALGTKVFIKSIQLNLYNKFNIGLCHKTALEQYRDTVKCFVELLENVSCDRGVCHVTMETMFINIAQIPPNKSINKISNYIFQITYLHILINYNTNSSVYNQNVSVF